MSGHADGRTRRSERSRAAIVRALYELVGEGMMRPTAQQVAERAGVGMRTVFRHFSDMETLYDEMNVLLRATVLPMLNGDPQLGDTLMRARGIARQRADLFEGIAPFKRAGNLLSWRSSYLKEQHAKMLSDLQADLLRWLPEASDASEELLDALDCATSFEFWNHLRGERKLSRKRTAAAMEQAVVALAAQLAE